MKQDGILLKELFKSQVAEVGRRVGEPTKWGASGPMHVGGDICGSRDLSPQWGEHPAGLGWPRRQNFPPSPAPLDDARLPTPGVGGPAAPLSALQSETGGPPGLQTGSVGGRVCAHMCAHVCYWWWCRRHLSERVLSATGRLHSFRFSCSLPAKMSITTSRSNKTWTSWDPSWRSQSSGCTKGRAPTRPWTAHPGKMNIRRQRWVTRKLGCWRRCVGSWEQVNVLLWF